MSAVGSGFAHRLSVIVPSVTLAVSSRAAALRAKGVDVFTFGVGEPDFDPAPSVLDAAKKAIDSGAHKYTAVSGIAPLKNAICADHARRRKAKVLPENVCVSVGAKHALFNVALALYESGDEVVIPDALLGELPRASAAGRRRAGALSDARRRRLAPLARRARQGAHAAHEGGHLVHAVEPDGRGVLRSAHARARRACCANTTAGSSSTRSTPSSSTTAFVTSRSRRSRPTSPRARSSSTASRRRTR